MSLAHFEKKLHEKAPIKKGEVAGKYMLGVVET